jgi:membrane fusion protein, heavy metal efflux system
MASPQSKKIAAMALAAAACALAVFVYIFSLFGDESSAQATAAHAQATPSGAVSGPSVVDASTLNLTNSQLAAVKVEPVGEREFPVEKEAVGSIDFNETWRSKSSRRTRGGSFRSLPERGRCEEGPDPVHYR